ELAELLMCRAHDRHIRPRQSETSTDRSFPPSPELPVRRPTAVDGIFLQGVLKKRGRGIRNLDVGEDERMDTEAPQVGKCLAKLRRCTQSRIRLVLRISAINPAHVPANDLERGYPVLLCVCCELRQFSKAMNDRILGVRQNDGLPSIFLTQPTAGSRDFEVLIVPSAIDRAGGVPISGMRLQRHGPGLKLAHSRVWEIYPTHSQADGLSGGQLRAQRPVIFHAGTLRERSQLKIEC